MAYETLILEKEGGVRIVTLNRPERLNAANYQLTAELVAVLEEIEEDAEARVMILTGAGRAFCAGADIKDVLDPTTKPLPVGQRHNFMDKLGDFVKPAIAAINGPCNGGGVEFALCCDFRIASETATFGLGEVKLGIIPSAGGTVRLPRLIGTARAKEFLYFGNIIGAQEAYQIGLVNKVVTPEELMAEAKKWAFELAERPPLALRMLKYCVNVGMETSLVEAIDYEARCTNILMRSEDRAEGMRAFVEKRKPVFKGR